MDFLWTEKWRPTKIEDFVLPDDIIVDLKKWIEDGHFPHLILYGTYGTGKTSIVKFLLSRIECDALELNASKENKLETMRTEVANFLNRSSLFGMKVVVFHEGENLTRRAQETLKEDIELNSDDTRVIFTTNHPEKLDGAIADRCLSLKIEPDDPKKVAKRIQYILKRENIEVPDDQKDALWSMVKEEFPSVRSTIKRLERSCRSGVLKIISNEEFTQYSEILELINTVSETNKVDVFYKIRGIVNTMPYSYYQGFYHYLYKNIDRIFNKGMVFDCMATIAEYNHMFTNDVDKEINVASLCKELIEIKANG